MFARQQEEAKWRYPIMNEKAMNTSPVKLEKRTYNIFAQPCAYFNFVQLKLFLTSFNMRTKITRIRYSSRMYRNAVNK